MGDAANNAIFTLIRYKKGLNYLPKDTAEVRASADLASLGRSLHGNLSAVYLKAHDQERALEHARRALELDARHVKSLYRIAQIQLSRDHIEEAEELAGRAVRLEPQNAIVRRLHDACLRRRREMDARERGVYQRMMAGNEREDEVGKDEDEDDDLIDKGDDSSSRRTVTPAWISVGGPLAVFVLFIAILLALWLR